MKLEYLNENTLQKTRTTGIISSNGFPQKEDYEPIDELVDEENASESNIQ